MRVFVTGASGHIGSALVPELVQAGHQVAGLARSEASAAALTSLGADVRRGDLDDLDALRDAALAADGVVHLAYKHDLFLNDVAAAAAADLRAIEVIGAALAGSDRPFVVTSGTLLLAHAKPGEVGTEEDSAPGGSRVDSENAAIALAQNGVRSSVVRLPPIVHSDLDRHGFAHVLVRTARDKGAAGYVGEGSNRWPAVHTRDAAHLFRLALEAAPAGSRLHGVADEGVPFRAIAETIARHLDVPVTSIAPDRASEHFGFLGPLVTLDNPTSAARTRDVLAWQPAHPRLLDDLATAHYLHRQSA